MSKVRTDPLMKIRNYYISGDLSWDAYQFLFFSFCRSSLAVLPVNLFLIFGTKPVPALLTRVQETKEVDYTG